MTRTKESTPQMRMPQFVSRSGIPARTSVEQWIAHEQRIQPSRRRAKILGNIWTADQGLTIMEAAEEIGLNRVRHELWRNVAVRDEQYCRRDANGNIIPEMVDVETRFDIVPALWQQVPNAEAGVFDFVPYYPERSIARVSDRFEHVPIYETLEEISKFLYMPDGKPVPITAAMWTSDLYKLIIQADLGAYHLFDGDEVGRYLSIVIGVTGNIYAIIYANRVRCLNQLPAIREVSATDGNFAIRHLKGAQEKTIAGAEHIVSHAYRAHSLMQEIYKQMGQVRITEAEAQKWYEQIYNAGEEPKRGKVLSEKGRILTQSFEDRHAAWKRNVVKMQYWRDLATHWMLEAANDRGDLTLYEFYQGAAGAATHATTKHYESYALEVIAPYGERVKEGVEPAFKIAQQVAAARGFEFSVN